MGAASAAHKVAEALNDYASAEHIRKPCNAFAVAVAVLERFGKMLRHKQCKVRVARLFIVALEAVSVNGYNAVCILVDDYAVRVHTKRSDVILEFFGFINYLAFVQLVGQMFENFRPQLYADAYVNPVRSRRNFQLATDCFHPLAAASARGNYAIFARIFFIGYYFEAVFGL